MKRVYLIKYYDGVVQFFYSPHLSPTGYFIGVPHKIHVTVGCRRFFSSLHLSPTGYFIGEPH
jgi:hypothetical protein